MRVRHLFDSAADMQLLRMMNRGQMHRCEPRANAAWQFLAVPVWRPLGCLYMCALSAQTACSLTSVRDDRVVVGLVACEY